MFEHNLHDRGSRSDSLMVMAVLLGLAIMGAFYFLGDHRGPASARIVVITDTPDSASGVGLPSTLEAIPAPTEWVRNSSDS
jgi:hypothetical protein